MGRIPRHFLGKTVSDFFLNFKTEWKMGKWLKFNWKFNWKRSWWKKEKFEERIKEKRCGNNAPTLWGKNVLSFFSNFAKLDFPNLGKITFSKSRDSTKSRIGSLDRWIFSEKSTKSRIGCLVWWIFFGKSYFWKIKSLKSVFFLK